MEFSTKFVAPENHSSACVAVGVFEPRRLSAEAGALDRASRGQIREFLRSGDMDGRAGSTRLLYRVRGVAAERVLLVGLGREKEFDERQFRDCARAALTALHETGARSACLYLAELPVPERGTGWKARQLTLAAADVAYRFDRMKSKKPDARPLGHITISAASKHHMAALEQGVREGSAIASGMALTRDLGNLPANVCTPTYLADAALKLGKEWKLAVEVLGQEDMETLGMGSLLSVSKGSRQAPKFAVLRYSGASKREKPIVLIGKGITFDTGGISIKPSAEMDEMKFDMCGAASVLGALRAVAELKLKLNVVGLVPACENMPGGAASKPGDIVTSMSGQTIEILNTDAEGRLILADALSYAERFQPQAVVDVATLTGACVIALGHVCSGLFANKESLAEELRAAGRESWDRVWQLPLWDDYQEQLKSNFADFANIGGRAAGSVTAACFLSRFARRYDWAHLDIAGTAWKSGKEKGATGRPVPLLTTFLMGRARRRIEI
jgi:leucyl aminopeptidase